MKYAGVLRQVTPEASQYWLTLTGDTLIGRDPSTCQIVLNSDRYGSVSRHHVRLHPETADAQHPIWRITDLGSVNGTFINGERLEGSLLLQGGDRIHLGLQGPEFILEYLPLTYVDANVEVNKNQSSITGPGLTLTQLLPILAIGQDWVRKAYLVPGIITVLAVILLFATTGNGPAFKVILAVYLGSAGYYFIYELCGKRKPWWVLLASLALEMLILVSPLLPLFIFIFRNVLPGHLQSGDTSFLSQLVRHFFGSGLMEELLKILPVFVAYGLGRWLRSPWRQKIGLWEPLDGILLGAAAALGFTWMETLGQYVPNIAGELGDLTGLQVLIPRVLGSLAGHMAYTGYFGYCIGLSVLYPKHRYGIVLVGWGVAALLHALWNASSVSFGPSGLVIVGIVSYVFLTAAILKARQLSPTRSQNFATRFYGYQQR